MTNVVKLRPSIPDNLAGLSIEANDLAQDIVDTSAQAMARLALWEAAVEDVKDLHLKRAIADHALKYGIANTIQLLRQEIKELLSWKASVEALTHD